MSTSFSIKNSFRRNREAMTTRTAQVGGYSFLMTLIVLGILVAVNVACSLLPSTWTQFDISSARLYSLTSDTKVVVNGLDQDVTIYWIVQSGSEDSVISKLLNVYDGMSDHITVVNKDPDVYPTFAAQYTDETVTNNSLIVECGDKYRYIPYSDIYESDTSSYYTTGSVSYSFNGEGKITTAIDYVTAEELPQVYLLSGHGEADLSDTFLSSLESSNIETQTFSLLNEDEIPEDADCILINAPTSDLSEEEMTILRDYIAEGGQLMVLSGPQEEEELTNLKSLLADYGVSTVEGVVVEGNRNNYAFSTPYILLPDIQSTDITSPLVENSSYVIVPIAQGLSIGSSSNGTVTSLLDTSSDAFSKIDGYALTTYEKEENDIDGSFSLAVTIEDSTAGGKIVWIASDYLMDDTYNAYSSGANTDLVMNSISWMIPDQGTISIRSKSLDYNYLTISTTTANVLKAWMIGVIPIGFLLLGIMEVIARRKAQS